MKWQVAKKGVCTTYTPWVGVIETKFLSHFVTGYFNLFYMNENGVGGRSRIVIELYNNNNADKSKTMALHKYPWHLGPNTLSYYNIPK